MKTLSSIPPQPVYMPLLRAFSLDWGPAKPEAIKRMRYMLWRIGQPQGVQDNINKYFAFIAFTDVATAFK